MEKAEKNQNDIDKTAPSSSGHSAEKDSSSSSKDSSTSDVENTTFKDQFKLFAKFGDSNSTGETIKLSNSDKWMKQAEVFGKDITTTDTAIYFKMISRNQPSLNMEEYDQFLEKLAESKKADVAEIKEKMTSCGEPGTSKTTRADKSDVVVRLTDPKKYTGSHKERFDESGKGRGKEGREDEADTEGYVQGYKDKGTYDKK